MQNSVRNPKGKKSVSKSEVSGEAEMPQTENTPAVAEEQQPAQVAEADPVPADVAEITQSHPVPAEVAEPASTTEAGVPAEVAGTEIATSTGTQLVVADQEFTPDPEAIPLTRVSEEQEQPQAVNNPKCAQARLQLAKPSAKMLRVITHMGQHPGRALRIKRWHLYRVGMTLQHCKETEGLDHLDVLFYEEHGLMQLRDATPEEVQSAEAAWQKSNTQAKVA